MPHESDASIPHRPDESGVPVQYSISHNPVEGLFGSMAAVSTSLEYVAPAAPSPQSVTQMHIDQQRSGGAPSVHDKLRHAEAGKAELDGEYPVAVQSSSASSEDAAIPLKGGVSPGYEGAQSLADKGAVEPLPLLYDPNIDDQGDDRMPLPEPLRRETHWHDQETAQEIKALSFSSATHELPEPPNEAGKAETPERSKAPMCSDVPTGHRAVIERADRIEVNEDRLEAPKTIRASAQFIAREQTQSLPSIVEIPDLREKLDRLCEDECLLFDDVDERTMMEREAGVEVRFDDNVELIEGREYTDGRQFTSRFGELRITSQTQQFNRTVALYPFDIESTEDIEDGLATSNNGECYDQAVATYAVSQRIRALAQDTMMPMVPQVLGFMCYEDSSGLLPQSKLAGITEYIGQPTVEHYLWGREVPRSVEMHINEIAELSSMIGKALGALHYRGILMHDFSPEQILRVKDGAQTRLAYTNLNDIITTSAVAHTKTEASIVSSRISSATNSVVNAFRRGILSHIPLDRSEVAFDAFSLRFFSTYQAVANAPGSAIPDDLQLHTLPFAETKLRC
jgi:hypothetical protein